MSGNKDGSLAQPGGMILESVKMGHPIMNVEINYRLGSMSTLPVPIRPTNIHVPVFGFAQSDTLLQEGSTNAGVRDQRLAIEWVHENIVAFGGDPSRITIHGQSSGGLAVGIQIMAYGGSRPYPFQGAICQSQALEPGITGNFTLHSTYRVWLNSSCTGNTFDSTENWECMRDVPMDVR